MAQWPRHPNADRHEAARTRKRPLPPRRVLPSLSTSMEIMMSDSKTLVVIGGSSGIGLRTAQVAAAGRPGHHRRPRPPAPGRGPEDPAAECHRQAGRRLSSTSLAAFFEDLPVVDMLFTPGTNYTVTPSPRRPRNRRAARSRQVLAAVPGRARGPAQTGAGCLGPADVRRGQRASRQGRRRHAAANAAIEGWPGAGHRAGAATRQRDRARHHRQ